MCILAKNQASRPVKTREVSVVCFLYQGIIEIPVAFFKNIFFTETKKMIRFKTNRCFLVPERFWTSRSLLAGHRSRVIGLHPYGKWLGGALVIR